MARPLKNGLDYFPLDVDIDQDDKVAMIEADYGVEGFGVLIKILMKIYKEGYYYEWDEREQKLFSRRVNVDINLVKEIVNACINEGIFDKGIFEEHKVLTSKGIQQRFLEATKRRKNEEALNEYSLISVNLHKTEKPDKPSKKVVNVNNNSVNDDIKLPETIVNDDISTQSKVKESKVKESKALKDNVEQLHDNIPYERIIDYLNRKAGSKYKYNSKETVGFINARFEEGYTAHDFKEVIDKKCKEWIGTKMASYLRPSTLFRKSNFSEYFGQPEVHNLPSNNSNNQKPSAMAMMLEKFNGGATIEVDNERNHRVLISQNERSF